MRQSLVVVAAVLAAVFAPVSVAAQAGGASISGLVVDQTGAALPGVTVEAESPVLIERMVSAVTDGGGRFTIINLRPGTYTVAFTIVGFSRVVRESIVLTGDGAAQVNAQLRVGAIEETVTVSGSSPLVDVQQVRRQAVVTREIMDVLPMGRSLEARALLIPGVQNNGISTGQYWGTFHGSSSRDTLAFADGMRSTNTFEIGGNYRNGWRMNDAATAELAFETGAAPAEAQVAGLLMNVIPKEGGNRFAGTSFLYFGNDALQSDNRTEQLKSLIQVTNKLAHQVDVNPAFGGPIVRNRLWFYSGYRFEGIKNYVADQFFKTGPLGFGRDGQQAFTENTFDSGLVRLTYQMTPRNKISFNFERNKSAYPFYNTSSVIPPETASNAPVPGGHTTHVKWTSPLSSHWFVDLGFSELFTEWTHKPQDGMYNEINYIEVTTGNQGGSTNLRGSMPDQRIVFRGSAAYVTGSHRAKFGIDYTKGWITYNIDYFADTIQLRFQNGVASQVRVAATPLGNYRADINADLGLYAQDQWTVGRLTFSPGIRFDYFRGGVPAQTTAAGVWVPARSFPAIPGPTWRNFSPRFGVAYDLFGDGNTAVKASVGKFVAAENTRLTLQINPLCCVGIAPNSELRAWRDLDGNRTIVDRNTGRIQYEEVGPSGNASFGLAANTTTLDPNLERDGQWEYTVQLQHQLLRGLSISGAYYRRNFTNLFYTNNRTRNHSDFTPFTITAPLDQRLPGGGGEVITLYNLNQDKFGLPFDSFLTNSTNTRVYNGVELAVNGRLGTTALFGGSITSGRTQTSNCEVDNPNLLRFCDAPNSSLTIFKAHGSLTLPARIMVSGFLQGMPGPSLGATYNVNSAIAGRPLTGGATISVPLIAPDTMFLPRQTNLDLRLARPTRFGRLRVNPLLDIYNVFNAYTTVSVNTTYGQNWQRVQSILRPRLFRVGLEVDF